MWLRLTLRGLLRAPAFALASIGTIALAVCLSTTVFAVVDGVLFKPLPYPEAGELYTLRGLPGVGLGGGLSTRDVQYLREAEPALPIARFGGAYVFRHPLQPGVKIAAQFVDAYFFEVLRKWPLIGGFAAADFDARPAAGEARAAVISYRLWRDHTGADPAAVGSIMELVETKIRIAGVLPADFVFPFYSGRRKAEIIFPIVDDRDDDRWSRAWTSLVRLPDEQRAAEARGRLDAAFAASVHDYPQPPTLRGAEPFDRVALEPLQSELGANERRFFGFAFAGAMLLILIACANVTSLALARTGDRARELRVCAALGASSREIAWLVGREVLAVTVLGAALGLALAYPALGLARSLLPDHLLLLKAPDVDWRVAAFALVAPAAVMQVFSLVPIARARRGAPGSIGPAGTTAPNRSWAASSLLAAESGMGIALLVTGAFVLASFAELRGEPSGFREGDLVVVDLLGPSTGAEEDRADFDDRVLARIAAVPGVKSAAAMVAPLLEQMGSGLEFDPPESDPAAWVSQIPVSGRFFETAGLKLLEGRFPTPQEIDSGRAITVLSEPAARTFWPEESALGRSVTADGRPYEVVGVVADVHMQSQREAMTFAEGFTPARLAPGFSSTYLVRAEAEIGPGMVASRVARGLARDIPGVIVRRAESLETALAKSVGLQRFQASLFGVAGGAALLLLSVGVAGIVAGSVRRRWREAGIRSALGASGGRIVRMLIADHLRPAATGIAVGLAVSWWAKDLLQAYLFGLEPDDMRVWAAASTLVLAVVALAAWLPARRAAAVDPAIVLRAD